VKRAALLPLLLAGCTVGPNFTRPHADLAPAFGPTRTDVASRVTGGEVDPRWWERFGDPELTSLVERLARQNLDLQQAAERIEQARAVRRIVSAQGLPSIQGNANADRQRQSLNGISSLTEPAPGAKPEFNLFSTMLSANWEIDLFGRVRRMAEAADATADAQVEARNGLVLSAIADLAQTYFQLRLVQAQFGVLNRNLAIAQRRRALVRNRFANGVATTLEVAQTDAQALAIAQDLPTLGTQQARLVNALGLLLAEPPRTLAAELKTAGQPAVPPSVPVGLPADLVRRRPDIREAEARLHAATAQTGVAVADFYPRVTLDGDFGFESLHLGSLFDWDSRQFMAGPGISLPIFQGGRLSGTLKLRESQQREAALQFRKVVLQAWHEVDNALVAYGEAQRRRVDAAATRDANARALAAADDQYRHGITTLLDVIAAQEGLLRGESTVAQAQADLEQRLVDLYRALGGGWQALTVPSPGSADRP
jgi:NodT family efflux transporter outer membrane factor (OMF) lipoprotein